MQHPTMNPAHDDQLSFQDVLVEQLRSTPWLLVSLCVHMVLALILNAMTSTPVVKTELEPLTAAAPVEVPPDDPPDEEPPDEQQVDPEETPDDPEPVNADENPEPPAEDPGDPDDEPLSNETQDDRPIAPFDAQAEPGSIGLGDGGLPGFQQRGHGGPGGGGGRPHVKNAAYRGLAWLAIHQSPDGRWDADGFMRNGDAKKGPLCDGRGAAVHDVGVTGLALLAFLGAGETHRTKLFGRNVRRGLAWLRSEQDADGCFGSRGDPHYTYGHAIATLAMVEAYGMTRSGLWRTSAQRGIDFVQRCRNPYKAWRYGERPGDNDVSVTGWMVMALKSGRLARLEVAEDGLRDARAFVAELTDEETGRTGYTKRGELPVRAEGREESFPGSESESLTAVGMIVRIFAGEDPARSDALKAGAELLTKRLPVWDPDSGRVDMYYWYYATLAMFQMGGIEWQSWNGRMKKAIIDSQRKDGNFKGSWDAVGPWGEDGGRVYATALMTMCLEVYYRYGRVFGTR